MDMLPPTKHRSPLYTKDFISSRGQQQVFNDFLTMGVNVCISGQNRSLLIFLGWTGVIASHRWLITEKSRSGNYCGSLNKCGGSQFFTSTHLDHAKAKTQISRGGTTQIE